MKNLLFVITAISLFSFIHLDNLEERKNTATDEGDIKNMGLEPISYFQAGAIIEKFSKWQIYSKTDYFIPTEGLNFSNEYDGFMFYFGGKDFIIPFYELRKGNIKEITLQFMPSKLISSPKEYFKQKFSTDFKYLYQASNDSKVLSQRKDLLIASDSELERETQNLATQFNYFRVGYPNNIHSYFIGSNAIKGLIGEKKPKKGIRVFLAFDHRGNFNLVMLGSNAANESFYSYNENTMIYATYIYNISAIGTVENGRSCIKPCPPCSD